MDNKAFRYRIYPDISQLELILKTVGSCRFVYNEALSAKEAAYKDSGTVLSTYDLIRRLPGLKKQFSWLQEVDSIALQHPEVLQESAGEACQSPERASS